MATKKVQSARERFVQATKELEADKQKFELEYDKIEKEVEILGARQSELLNLIAQIEDLIDN